LRRGLESDDDDYDEVEVVMIIQVDGKGRSLEDKLLPSVTPLKLKPCPGPGGTTDFSLMMMMVMMTMMRVGMVIPYLTSSIQSLPSQLDFKSRH
jgi:hypothetical protein